MDATFGLKPCCAAWVQNVVKSGGMGTPVKISTPAVLNAPIWAEKSSVGVPLPYRPGSVTV